MAEYEKVCGCWSQALDGTLMDACKATLLRAYVTKACACLLNAFKVLKTPETLRLQVQAEVRELRGRGIAEKDALPKALHEKGQRGFGYEIGGLCLASLLAMG